MVAFSPSSGPDGFGKEKGGDGAGGGHKFESLSQGGEHDEMLMGSKRLGKLQDKFRGFKARMKQKLLDRLLVSVEKDKQREKRRMGSMKLKVAAPLGQKEDITGPSTFSEVELMRLIETWDIESDTGADAEKVSAPWMERWGPGPELIAAAAEQPELQGLSELTMGRFNSLGKGDVSKSVSLMLDFVRWRRSSLWGMSCTVEEVCPESPGVADQIRSGKCFIVNEFTEAGAPLIIVKVARHNPDSQELDVTTRFVVHALFEAEKLLSEPESSQFAIVFDMQGASIKNVDYQAVKRFISILTQYTPERLGMMLIYDAPGFFSGICFPMIKPWLNPETAKKVHFVSKGGAGLAGWVGTACLPVQYGGVDTFDYDAALEKGLGLCRLASVGGPK